MIVAPAHPAQVNPKSIRSQTHRPLRQTRCRSMRTRRQDICLRPETTRCRGHRMEMGDRIDIQFKARRVVCIDIYCRLSGPFSSSYGFRNRLAQSCLLTTAHRALEFIFRGLVNRWNRAFASEHGESPLFAARQARSFCRLMYCMICFAPPCLHQARYSSLHCSAFTAHLWSCVLLFEVFNCTHRLFRIPAA